MSKLDTSSLTTPMEFLNESINAVAHKVIGYMSAGPPQKPKKSDETHRFYLCQIDKDRMNSYKCAKKMQEEAVAGEHEGYVQVIRNKDDNYDASNWVPAVLAVSIKKGCPETFDQLNLSSKLGAPVSLVTK